MFAIVAPGQGAQVPGTMVRWLRDPVHRERVDVWSAAADVDLHHLGTRAGADEIARTENTQPLLVALGLLALDARRQQRDGDGVVAGHSVGELTAAGFAGALAPADAVRLAAVRGRLMARACAVEPTGMSAVLGGEPGEVLDRIAALDLEPATFNGPGQVVAAGRTEDLHRLAQDPPTGSTVKPLAVAGAFHTRFMRPAVAGFEQAVADTTFSTPELGLVSNADGRVLRSGGELARSLVGQLTSPVRFDRCLLTLEALEPAFVIAVPPARTLTQILARRLPGVEVRSIASPRDLAGPAPRREPLRREPTLVGGRG